MSGLAFTDEQVATIRGAFELAVEIGTADEPAMNVHNLLRLFAWFDATLAVARDPLEPLRVMGATVHELNRDHERRDSCVACAAARPVLAALETEAARRQAAGEPLE